MTTTPRRLLIPLLLCAAGSAGAAPVIGALEGSGAAQSAFTAEGYDRLDTEAVLDLYADALAALPGAGAVALAATGTEVTLRYLGTSAAHAGTLRWAGLGDLFSTRDGLSAADAMLDFSNVIGSIGLQRTVGGLALGDALDLAFDTEAFDGTALGLAGHAGGSAGPAHAVDLGGGRWLLGFESWGAQDFSDALLLVEGVAQATAAVPLPGSLPLTLAGLTLLAGVRRRQSTPTGTRAASAHISS
ncbi:MAG: hypothetical protein JNL87_00380 [Burkholderiaceae bacterium]|nr:hypothetical protein [Burkholderiaceae bacterium]